MDVMDVMEEGSMKDIIDEFNSLPKPPETYGERKYWGIAKRLAEALQDEITTRDNSCACEFPEGGGEPVKECFYHETRKNMTHEY